MDKFDKYLYGTMAVLGTMVVLTLLRALVLRDLWTWFVVPLGVPGIGLAHAVGISTIVAYLTYQRQPQDPDERRRGAFYVFLMATMAGVVMPLFSWGVGWIARHYMVAG